MTLKAIKQLTNIGWMIGGVSATTAGYSYINSKKDQVFLKYTKKALGTISSIEDIEEYEKQKGCMFVYYTKKGDSSRNQIPWVAKYNEWIDGGVLSARNYVHQNNDRKDIEKTVIKITDQAKEDCANGKIIYKEIDKASPSK